MSKSAKPGKFSAVNVTGAVTADTINAAKVDVTSSLVAAALSLGGLATSVSNTAPTIAAGANTSALAVSSYSEFTIGSNVIFFTHCVVTTTTNTTTAVGITFPANATGVVFGSLEASTAGTHITAVATGGTPASVGCNVGTAADASPTADRDVFLVGIYTV